MSENLFQLFTAQYTSNLELKLQQRMSLLRGKISEGFYVGKMASPVNQVGAIKLNAPAGRFSPKNRTDADFTRRWVFPQPGEIDQLIDSFDELETIVDPKSAYLENAASAVARAWDDCVIAAAFGTAQTGVDIANLSAETFDTSAFGIAVTFANGSTSIGLTVRKMIEAKRILRHYHNDFERDPLFAVIGSQQEADLLNQVQVVSTEFNDRPVLVDGRITRFLGFDIIVTERLGTVSENSTTNRACIFGVKSGLHLGVWRDMANRVSIRNELSGEPYDLYTAVMYGATRTQPGKILRVNCLDGTGADITP